MQDVTEAMIRELFAEDARVPATLITFEAAELDEPIRVTDHPDGLISRGNTFVYVPFAFTFGGASAEEAERGATLEIGNADGAIVHALRSLTEKPFLTAEIVRVAAPDNVELAMSRSPVKDIDASRAAVTLSIRPRDFDGVFACAPRYVAARTPALF